MNSLTRKKNGGATEVRALHRHVSFHVLLKFGRVWVVSKRNINSFMFAQIPLINLNGLKRLQSHIRTYIHRHAAPRKTRLEAIWNVTLIISTASKLCIMFIHLLPGHSKFIQHRVAQCSSTSGFIPPGNALCAGSWPRRSTSITAHKLK